MKKEKYAFLLSIAVLSTLGSNTYAADYKCSQGKHYDGYIKSIDTRPNLVNTTFTIGLQMGKDSKIFWVDQNASFLSPNGNKLYAAALVAASAYYPVTVWCANDGTDYIADIIVHFIKD